MSYETNFTIKSRKLVKQIRRMFYPQTQPENIRKGKHRPLRVIKKWFNRYCRKRLLGSTIFTRIADKDISVVIYDIRMRKICSEIIYTIKGEKRQQLDISWEGGKPILYISKNGETELPRATI